MQFIYITIIILNFVIVSEVCKKHGIEIVMFYAKTEMIWWWEKM